MLSALARCNKKAHKCEITEKVLYKILKEYLVYHCYKSIDPIQVYICDEWNSNQIPWIQRFFIFSNRVNLTLYNYITTRHCNFVILLLHSKMRTTACLQGYTEAGGDSKWHMIGKWIWNELINYKTLTSQFHPSFNWVMNELRQYFSEDELFISQESFKHQVFILELKSLLYQVSNFYVV